jgi:hypothetical protein
MVTFRPVREIIKGGIETMKDIKDIETIRITQVPLSAWVGGVALVFALGAAVVMVEHWSLPWVSPCAGEC